MSSEPTFTYFKPSPNLRPAYGGGAAAAGGDSKELSPADLTLRWLAKQLGYPKNGVRFIAEKGTDSGGATWLKMASSLYNAVSLSLMSDETATATTTAPTGYARTAPAAKLMPGDDDRVDFTWRGDSIGFGTLTTQGNTKDTMWGLIIAMKQAINWLDSAGGVFGEGVTDDLRFHNISLGSSSFANTDDNGGATPSRAQYPLVESLAYNQRTKTLPLRGPKMKFGYFLMTNDGAYDTTLSAAGMYDRLVTGVGRFRSDFPDTPLSLWTIMKRTEDPTLNAKFKAYNNLMRAGVPGMSNVKLFDVEAKVDIWNIDTGNTTNTTYWNTDGIHPKTAGNAYAAAIMADEVWNWLMA